MYGSVSPSLHIVQFIEMTDIDPLSPAGAYDPAIHRMLSFHDAAARFTAGADTPRAYLERCIERIEALEPAVMAFAFLNLQRAREAADQAGARYKAGRPLGPVDGMPVGIKDLIETYDMPTEFGSELFRGHQPMTDAASVRALRQGGAVLVGKTVTVCFGGGDPARTRNPFDTRRTPGGSSSGTAAAIASRMLPGALGTHARGSTIRPASFCGAYALKPTFGAINRQGSFSMAYSMDHVGVFGGTLSDMWRTARYIAGLAGGDPSYPGLYGGEASPAPRKPARLIRLDTAGWPAAESAAKDQFERFISGLVEAGVEIVSRHDDPAVEAYEAAHTRTPALWANLYRYEMHWPMLQYRERFADKMPPRLLKGIEDGAHMTLDTYRAALTERESFRAMHEELARRADGFITLSSPGPGPVGMDQGSAIFNEASSILGAPAINLPLLAVDRAPLGLQLLGGWHGDERLTAAARWLAETHFGNPA
jgi:Asp-tRNA(Asn)/Glu-tRNA(Gln) amidotransferase A subunit family amidase